MSPGQEGPSGPRPPARRRVRWFKSMGLPCSTPVGAGTGAFFCPASAYTPSGARGLGVWPCDPVRQTWLRVPPGEVVPIGTPLAAESAGGRVHDGGPGPQPVSGPVPSEGQPFPELNCYGGDRPIRPPIRPRVSATVGSVGGPSGSRPCRHHHPTQRPRTTSVSYRSGTVSVRTTVGHCLMARPRRHTGVRRCRS
jgi:hypothetical protein